MDTPAPDMAGATYDDLRRIAGFLMAREPPGHTLQATALVNEAYLKLVGGAAPDWHNRRHFVNTVARAMRQILIDRARRRAAVRHGGGLHRIDLAAVDAARGRPDTLDPDAAAALERAVAELEQANPRWGEIVHLRYFAGLTIEQAAEVMDISPALVKKDWAFARAWLQSRLSAAASPAPAAE